MRYSAHPIHRVILVFFFAFVARGVSGQTTFDHDHGVALTPIGVAGDLLTEGFPGAPTVAITAATIGLV